MCTRVFVGGLSHRARERDLDKFFKNYGSVKEVTMKNGFAFVEFGDRRDADDAIYDLNGKDLLGERVSVEKARGTPRGSWRGGGNERGYLSPKGKSREKYGPSSRTDFRLHVDNLSSRVSWQDLKDFMRQAGEVTYADAHKQRRNEGVVEFASYSDMKNAVNKLNDTDLNGRRIRLIEHKKRKDGRRSESPSNRSRSRSRSHSMARERSRSRSKSKSSSRSRSTSPDSCASKSKNANL